MKTKIYTLSLIVCAFLFSNCGGGKVENASPNLNKSNQANNVGNNVNNSLNTDSGNQKNAGDNSQDKAEFEGTAGITDKKSEIKEIAVLKEIRTAQHENYDRVVFEFEGGQFPGYHLEYIDKPVRACGSGNVVNLKGDGWLEVRFQPAVAHTEEGQPTITEREISTDHKILKELKQTCDFEADVTWVLGVLSPNRYRVLELKNPTRLAVDIKH